MRPDCHGRRRPRGRRGRALVPLSRAARNAELVATDSVARRQPFHAYTSMKNETKEPLLKRLMDNPWLLLVLGVLIPLASYTLWGWVELGLVKTATLP